MSDIECLRTIEQIKESLSQMEVALSPNRIDSNFDTEKIYQDFPILHRPIRGKRLVFLDSAASTQKPQVVIEAVNHFYRAENANIHRGVYFLSELATQRYEDARETVRGFINAAATEEVIFTSGTTDGINLVANTFGQAFISEGDEILISAMEHHANIVPWQLLCERRGAKLKVLPMTESGELDLSRLDEFLTDKTRLFSLVTISNSLGTVNPVQEVIRAAHARNVPVLLDAAQSMAHQPIDVQALDCDFLVFSGHKLLGPTGIGVLYGKRSYLEQLPPYRGGGDMIKKVTFEKTTYADLPARLEAGTPHIAGAVGLAAAINYVQEIGLSKIANYETELLNYGLQQLQQLPGLRVLGSPRRRAGAISFTIEGIHPHDIGTFLDQEGIAVRVGHHCTQPVMDFFGVPATTRASVALYNAHRDFDDLASALKNVIKVFS